MIGAQELVLYLNAPKFAAMVERADSFADLTNAGHLKLTVDRDTIVAITASATAPMPLTMPSTTA